jgi:hypothetical protein
LPRINASLLGPCRSGPGPRERTGDWSASRLLLRPQLRDKASGLRVSALTDQRDNRDLAPRHLVNVPHNDPVYAGAPLDGRAGFVY